MLQRVINKSNQQGVTQAMKPQVRLASLFALLFCLLTASATTSLAQTQTQRDPLAGLKRAITRANAPALTTQQETALTTLITNYRDSLPDEPDAQLEAAREAYDAAILARNATAAATQAQAIATRSAALTLAKLQGEATFEIAVLNNLNSGGQLAPLTTELGNDGVLRLVNSLAGGRGFGGPGGPGGGGRGGGRH
jgi:hypothetical protein